jgi:L-lactate utilization protein LutB
METGVITKRLKIISDLQEELNGIHTAFQEAMEDDPAYQKLQEEMATFRESSKEKKTKVTSNATLKSMADQMRELKLEINENKDVLAQELADYYKESGSLEIVDSEGQVKRIVFSAKLVNS